MLYVSTPGDGFCLRIPQAESREMIIWDDEEMVKSRTGDGSERVDIIGVVSRDNWKECIAAALDVSPGQMIHSPF